LLSEATLNFFKQFTLLTHFSNEKLLK